MAPRGGASADDLLGLRLTRPRPVVTAARRAPMQPRIDELLAEAGRLDRKADSTRASSTTRVGRWREHEGGRGTPSALVAFAGRWPDHGPDDHTRPRSDILPDEAAAPRPQAERLRWARARPGGCRPDETRGRLCPPPEGSRAELGAAADRGERTAAAERATFARHDWAHARRLIGDVEPDAVAGGSLTGGPIMLVPRDGDLPDRWATRSPGSAHDRDPPRNPNAVSDGILIQAAQAAQR